MKKDRGVNSQFIDILGCKQNANFISESNLYKVIFQNRKSEAEKFQDWFIEEVLPEIRKTGLYLQMPKNYSEALRAFANEVEQKELMKKQRDEAIRTKAWISDKKTATVINTASQKSKEVESLQRELGKSKEYASIKVVKIKTRCKFDWKSLRKCYTSHELEMPKTFDANYGSIRTYPAQGMERNLQN